MLSGMTRKSLGTESFMQEEFKIRFDVEFRFEASISDPLNPVQQVP